MFCILLFHESTQYVSSVQKEAALNELLLLFETKQYDKYIEEATRVHSLIEEKDKGLISFYLGASHFYLDHFDAAQISLLSFINTHPTNEEHIRFALQALSLFAYKTKDCHFLASIIEQTKNYPCAEEIRLNDILALSALILENQDYEKGVALLEETKELFANSPKQETVLFYYGQALLGAKWYEKARELWDFYVTTYATSDRIVYGWQNLIFTLTELINTCNATDKKNLQLHLAQTLQSALANQHLLSSEMVQQYKLRLTHLLFECDKKQEALAIATEYLNTYPTDIYTKELYLLSITCLIDLKSPKQELINTIEKALTNPLDLSSETTLHLELYNAYLTEKEFAKSREHLFWVYQNTNHPLKQENLFWLAEELEYAHDEQTAIAVLEKALGITQNVLQKSALLDARLFEEKVLELKKLYVQSKNESKATSLLSQLLEMEQTDTTTSWRFLHRVQFELADLYEQQGKIDHAIELYNTIIEDNNMHPTSYFFKASLLRKSQLEFMQLQEKNDPEQKNKISSILNILKDLQIAKNVRSEPIHIESALTYAEIRCVNLPEEEALKKRLFYLERIEEDFIRSADENTVNYTKDRERWPEQDKKITNYMRYVEAEKNRIQSILAKNEGNEELSIQLRQSALRDFKTLYTHRENQNDSLQKRILLALQTLDSLSN